MVRLEAKVGAAEDPRAALDAWIDEILSFGHQRAKAVRVSVLSSPGAMKAEGYAEETQHATRVLMAPLERLLAEGVADGSFPLADPVADAPLIQSVAWAAAGLSPMQERALPARRGVTAGALVLRACAGGYAFSVRDQRAGSPSSTRMRPSSSSTRRCDTASPTAARRMNPAMSSH